VDKAAGRVRENAVCCEQPQHALERVGIQSRTCCDVGCCGDVITDRVGYAEVGNDMQAASCYVRFRKIRNDLAGPRRLHY
jgi:hypothetical protein